MIRVLMINWRDIKHQWAGGSERHQHEIAKCLVNWGHSATILSSNHFGDKGINEEYIDGIRHIRMGGQYTVHLIAPLYYFFKLRNKYDVVIDVEHGIPFFILLTNPRLGFCIVHHVHANMFFIETKFPFSFVGYFIEKFFLPYLYKNKNFLVDSESTKSDLIRLRIPEKNIQVVNPGLDHNMYCSSTSCTKYNQPTIIYMGRLRKYKRVHILITAFAEIIKKVPNAKLIIAGDGVDRQFLKEQVSALGLNEQIDIMGYVPDAQKVELLQKSWVYVTPSSVEGWGLGILEANACGTPAIGFDVPGVQESIKHGSSGKLVKTEQELIETCVEILQDSALRKYLEEGALTRASELSWESTSNTFLKILESKLK